MRVMDYPRKMIEPQCSVCGDTYLQQERLYRNAKWKDRCSKHRKNIKHNLCTDCKAKISKGANRCKECSNKSRTIRAKNFCGCGKEIGFSSNVCLECHNKSQNKGKSKERTKFQNSKQWKNVREIVYMRDDFTCSVCNIRGGILECHHIKTWKDYPSLRLEQDNLLTVCYDCHKIIHFEKHST